MEKLKFRYLGPIDDPPPLLRRKADRAMFFLGAGVGLSFGFLGWALMCLF